MDTLTSVRAGRHLLREEGAAMREQKSGQTMDTKHVSVFPQETLELLSLRSGDVVVDGTAGQGGHDALILQKEGVQLIALDADPDSVARVGELLKPYGARAQVVEGNFGHLKEVLAAEGITSVDKVLLDLGWNKGQLHAGRGFSFAENEPLNMSYGPVPASSFTAAQILNEWSEETLANVFFGYGEERYARRIAKTIVALRIEHPFVTTKDLVDAIMSAVPAAYRRGRLHPATRSFQALRIAVNDEFRTLEQGLLQAWELVKPQGRIVVITFHSLEDRIVKQFFKQFALEGGTILTKKPLQPSTEELHINPSARSAKLRAIEKI